MKKKLSVLMLVVLLVSQIYVVPAFAVENAVQDIVDFENDVLRGYDKLLQYAGMIIDPAITATRSSYQFVKDRLVALGLVSDSATVEDVQHFFDDNITVSPHSDSHHQNVEYKSPLNIYIQNEMSSIISDSGYTYLYSFNLINSISAFGNGDQYNALRRWIVANDDGKSYLFYFLKSNTLYAIKFYNQDIGFVQTSIFGDMRTVDPTSYANWTSINLFTQQSGQNGFYYFVYNGDSKEFVSVNSINTGSVRYMTTNINSSINNQHDKGYFMSVNKNSVYKVFKSVNDLKLGSQGLSPYYVSDSYNTYKNVSGSYNTTTYDNSVTYGDVTNYINSFNTENGRPPTPNEIQIHIDTGGGGSGGDSGGGSGGSGGSGDSSSIWDFLSRLGEVLGGLIKNLGNMLTSLIDSIITIINDVVGKIPDIFTGLLNLVFGGLPEDIRAIIILGITVMVVYGIIKVIRG